MNYLVGPNGEGRIADFNYDGVIDDRDFELLKACYLADTGQRPECAAFDIDHTGRVNTLDFSIFANIFGGYDPVSHTRLQPYAPPWQQALNGALAMTLVGGIGAIMVKEARR